MLNEKTIKNVIFDVGNVLVRWAPLEVISTIFTEVEPMEFYQKVRPIWIDLNLGKLTEKEAILLYEKQLSIPASKITKLINELTYHQKPLDGSIELLGQLQNLGLNLYAITDNTKEIMDYHRMNSDFPKYFKDIIVSADVGILKPDNRIYKILIDKHNLNPSQSVFIDDMEANVEGAIKVGMQAFQFTNAISAKENLIKIGIGL